MVDVILWAALASLVVAVLGLAAWAIVPHVYSRATVDAALVRSGAGGVAVRMVGGMLHAPLLQQVRAVSLRRIALTAACSYDQALSAADGRRVDATLRFVLHVGASPGAVLQAARCFGAQTDDPEHLQAILGGALTSAMRRAAAAMSAEALYDDRDGFADRVRAQLTPALDRLGLEVDSVHVTALEQTPATVLSEDNGFDALALERLVEAEAAARLRRAEIRAASDRAVQAAEREAEEARLAHELAVETHRAAHRIALARLGADTEAEIAAERRRQSQTSVTDAVTNATAAIASMTPPQSVSDALAERSNRKKRGGAPRPSPARRSVKVRHMSS